MAEQNLTKTKLLCCECEVESAGEGEKFEIEVLRYSRHGVGVAHIGRLCENCYLSKGVQIAAEA